MTDLLERTVLVLNDSDGHADKRTRTLLARQFASHSLTVIGMPYIRTCAPGATGTPVTKRD